jgi:hypothetical protein
MIVLRIRQVGDFDVRAIPAVVTAPAILPSGEGVGGGGSVQHPGRAVADAAVLVIVPHVIARQEWGVVLARVVARDAVFVRDARLLHVVGHRRLRKDNGQRKMTD